MNKFIIFALLLVFVLNDDLDDYIYEGKDLKKCEGIYSYEASVNNCTSITLEDDDFTCCFESYKYEGHEHKECTAAKKKKVNKIIDIYEDELGYTDVSIDCSSNYNKITFIIFITYCDFVTIFNRGVY